MDIQIYVNLFNSMIDAANAQGSSLVSEGVDLTGKLFGIMVGWYFLQWILSETTAETLALVLNTLFKACFIWFLLSSWNGGFVSDFFKGTMDSIAQTATGGSANSATGMQGIVSTIETINRSERAEAGSSGGFWNNLVSKISDWKSILTLFGLPQHWIMTALLKAIATGLLMLLAAVYMLIVNMGAVLIAVGMILGPVLVPWLLLEPASFLFDGWLRFMITAALWKIVGAALMVITNAAIVAARSQVDNSTLFTATSTDIQSLIVVSIITCIGIFMMWQAPSIASGLVSGSGGATLKNFGRGFVGRNLFRRFQ